nr:M20/M25/M40 family metallo-hydrolase [Gulosibacter bifidus]
MSDDHCASTSNRTTPATEQLAGSTAWITPEIGMLESDPTVVTTRELIRMDTQNWGGGVSSGEQEAAEYLEARLRGLGVTPTVFEAAPGRTSVVARIPGRNPDKPALVVHGHTDVVPAAADDWTYDPFGAEIHDGMIWGRGAVDMKNMDAMIITALESMQQRGLAPERELIVAFFADEEDAGRLGAQYAVDTHPELFAGATEAISEVGGFSINVDGKRAYLMQTGEKGMLWLRLHAHRRAGHGSRKIDPADNAIIALSEAICRIANTDWPLELGETASTMVAAIASLADAAEPGSQSPDDLAARAGTAASWLTAALRVTANPTMLTGGYKHNVVPESASVAIDVRPVPGKEQDTLERIREIVGPEIDVEIDWQVSGYESPVSSELVSQATRSLRSADPGAAIIPYLLPAGTDNKALGRLGIAGYGFTPLLLPAELNFPGMFHGVDERVPMSSLVFGRVVLEDFLLRY